MNPDLERYSTILVKALIVLTIVVTVFVTMNYLIPLTFNVSQSLVWGFLPFILAALIAILIDPVVDWLSNKKKMKRGLAVAVTLLLVFSLITTMIIFIISRLAIELSGLYANLPTFTQHLMKFSIETVEKIRIYITNNPLQAETQRVLQSNLQSIIRGLTDLITKATNLIFDLLTGLPGFVTIIIVSGLATFFISRDKALITNFVYRLIPKKYIRPTSMVIGEISLAVLGFFRAQTILLSITGLLTIIGLSILDVSYALTIGIIVGIFDLLPVLGPGTILLPWAVVEFIIGKISFGTGLLILYSVIIGVRQLIEPKIISQQIGLHPLATLMSLYLGLRFIGIWGILIGPFLVILGKAIVKSMYFKK